MHRLLLIPLAFALIVPGLLADDSMKAAATRKKSQQKITVEYKDTLFRDVVDELNDKVPPLGVRADTKGGVNLNLKITYSAKDKPAAEVLNDLCDKFDMGWYIISNKGDGYDGTVMITRGKERGYKKGKEPDKTAGKPDKEKPDKTASKPDKEKPDKEKPDTTKPDKDKSDATKEKPEDDPEQVEKDAARKLRLAKELLEDGKTEKAHERFEEVIKKFPKTKAAEEAKKLLEKSDKDK